MTARLLVPLVLSFAATLACSGDSKNPAGTLPSAGFATPGASVDSASTPQFEKAGHPRGTRTGIPHIDAVIKATEGFDVNRFLGLFEYFSKPCNSRGLYGAGLVLCPNGAPYGTSVAVAGFSDCEGTVFYPDEEPTNPNVIFTVTEFMTMQKAQSIGPTGPVVYAVIQGNALPQNPGVPVIAVIVFVSGQVVSVGSSGVTYVQSDCDETGEEVVSQIEQRLEEVDFQLLPP